MYKPKCPSCKSTHTVKNGRRDGRQLYVCKECGHQFRIDSGPSAGELWQRYQDGKQTVSELAKAYSVSESTVKRRLRSVRCGWEQPSLSGGGFVHLDATYWGRSWGVLLALDEEGGMPLYVQFIRHERVQDYKDAVRSIEERGYRIRGLILDGMQSLFAEFSAYPLQMCHFHMRQIVNRYITRHPKLLAAKSLQRLMEGLPKMDGRQFADEFSAWKKTWEDVLNRRSHLKSGKTRFTHRRLRSAMHSIDFYLPFLFTFQRPDCAGMSNTNNKIEGTFTDLKKNLNNHSGMSEMNRLRFISGFFLALAQKTGMEKQESQR